MLGLNVEDDIGRCLYYVGVLRLYYTIFLLCFLYYVIFYIQNDYGEKNKFPFCLQFVHRFLHHVGLFLFLISNLMKIISYSLIKFYLYHFTYISHNHYIFTNVSFYSIIILIYITNKWYIFYVLNENKMSLVTYVFASVILGYTRTHLRPAEKCYDKYGQYEFNTIMAGVDKWDSGRRPFLPIVEHLGWMMI